MARRADRHSRLRPYWLREGPALCIACEHGVVVEAVFHCTACDALICSECVVLDAATGEVFCPECRHADQEGQ